MIIRIKNLHLRTIIGFQEWERTRSQEVVVNLDIEIDDETAAQTDNVDDSVDYKELKYRIVERAEQTQFYLLERLAGFILDIVMESPKVSRATVEIDKPHALRFAESVSIRMTCERK